VSFGSDRCRTCRDGKGAAKRVKAQVTTTTTVRTQRAPSQAMLVWVLASAGLALMGAIGPWVKVLGIGINATSGPLSVGMAHHGWYVAGAVVCGGLLVFGSRTTRAAGAWALVGGTIGSAITIHDHHVLSGALSKAGPIAQEFIQVGWGLKLAMAACVSLAVSGLVWLVRG
jgi:hypothetical protein